MLRTVTHIRNLPREREIAEAFVRHGFGFVLRRYRIGRSLLRVRGVPQEGRLPVHWGDQLVRVLEELGPTYIKLGQLLSVRPDILPPDALLALRGLRDQVTPVPFAEVRTVIEAELGDSVDNLFDDFDPAPIGSASIGQVYIAHHGGQKVAVKVQRPRAAAQVAADLAVLADLADFVQRHSTDLFFEPVKVIDEFRQFMQSELDYLEEARNTDLVRKNFEGDDRVRIPFVHWDRSTTRVLTTEFLDGTSLSRLDVSGFSLEEKRGLAVLGAQLSMTQVFEHGAFHGDAHPSNILVMSPGQFGLIDFGLVGYISERELHILTDYFIDLIRQDSTRLLRDLRNLGVVIPREHEEDIQAALGQMMRRYMGVTLAQIDTTRLVTELLDLFYRYRMRLPTKYFLILRGLITVEGTGRELYPEFNVFEVAEPYVRRMALRRYNPRSLATENLGRVSDFADMVSRYPQQISDVLQEVEDTLRETRRLEAIVDKALASTGRFYNRVAAAIFLAALVIGSSQIHYGPKLLGDIPVFAALMFLTSLVVGFWLLVGILRSGFL